MTTRKDKKRSFDRVAYYFYKKLDDLRDQDDGEFIARSYRDNMIDANKDRLQFARSLEMRLNYALEILLFENKNNKKILDKLIDLVYTD